MKIKIEELKEKLAKVALQFVDKESAKYFADECIEAHIRKSPRSNPLKSTIGDLEACIKNSNSEIKYKIDLPSYFSIDFHSHGPLVYLKRIHDELENRSFKNGIAMTSFTNSQSMHTLHTWVQGLAKRGLMSIAICNGGPSAVVPFNGTKGVFGTNPIAYGIPGENDEIFCVDMATSEAPYFEIMDSYKNKTPMREGIAVDGKGKPTTDPTKALDFSDSETDPYSNLLPMGGGYKGYYIVYLMEMMTSALIGMPSSTEMTPDFVPEEHGAVLIVFNPNAMGTAETFAKSLKSLHQVLSSQSAREGTEIRVPGQENNKKFANFDSEEIEVDEKIVERLNNLL